MATATLELPAAARTAGEELSALVEAHSRMVYRIAYSVLRTHHDAEDAVQETFLKVWRAADKMPAIRDRKAWIARIAWNAARDHARAGSARTGVDIEDVALAVLERRRGGATAEQLAAAEEMQRLLENLIAGLPAKLRDVITLSTVEELEHSEIASVLGIGEAKVRMRLFQARGVLREKLARVLGRD